MPESKFQEPSMFTTSSSSVANQPPNLVLERASDDNAAFATALAPVLPAPRAASCPRLHASTSEVSLGQLVELPLLDSLVQGGLSKASGVEIVRSTLSGKSTAKRLANSIVQNVWSAAPWPEPSRSARPPERGRRPLGRGPPEPRWRHRPKSAWDANTMAPAAQDRGVGRARLVDPERESQAQHNQVNVSSSRGAPTLNAAASFGK